MCPGPPGQVSPCSFPCSGTRSDLGPLVPPEVAGNGNPLSLVFPLLPGKYLATAFGRRFLVLRPCRNLEGARS